MLDSGTHLNDAVMSIVSRELLVETIGWTSTLAFLISILMPNRVRLHQFGVFSSLTTGFYAYEHGATAIWVKWLIAFFFHLYMWFKVSRKCKVAHDPNS